MYLADKNALPPLVQGYFTGSTPTILFIKPDGELFFRFIGARPPKTFLMILKTVQTQYEKGN
jgi:thioredoxin-related protein